MTNSLFVFSRLRVEIRPPPSQLTVLPGMCDAATNPLGSLGGAYKNKVCAREVSMDRAMLTLT